MTDARLRTLERRYRSSRSPADEERWLVARQRAGELSLEQLHWAAHVGSQGAQRLLGVEAVAPSSNNAWPWADALVDAGPMLAARASLAVTEAVIRDTWVEPPQIARSVATRVRDAMDGGPPYDARPDLQAFVNTPAFDGFSEREHLPLHCLMAVSTLNRYGSRNVRGSARRVLSAGCERLGCAQTHDAVARDVLPWVLAGARGTPPPPVVPRLLLTVEDASVLSDRQWLKPPIRMRDQIGNAAFKILLRRPDGSTDTYTTEALLPEGFSRTPFHHSLSLPTDVEVPLGTEVWETSF